MVSALSTKGSLGERVIWEFRVGVKLSGKACIQGRRYSPQHQRDNIYTKLKNWVFCLVFRDKVALCSFNCPKTHYVHQAIRELLMKMCLLLLPKSWD